ncbi:hypothetical protein STCU_00907 [Strigomonas culicis]|nr:hypothetical protein STCU_00907 [Strigomonas culicis]|eukprot:EPY35797.1 hypothetical protein STCU_00907 [Strigomonas culicis]
MRRVSIQLQADTHSEGKEKMLQTTVLPYVSTCKRTCSTTQAVCEQVLDSSEMDDFSAAVLKLSQRHKTIAEPSVWEPLITQTCHQMDMCLDATNKRNAFIRQYRKDPAVYQKLIEDEAPAKLDEDEIEVEQMMDNFNRVDGKKTSVFSREEMVELQSALLRGDKKAAARIDPSIVDLSDEEFESIQNLAAKQGYVRGGRGDGEKEGLFHMTDDESDL